MMELTAVPATLPMIPPKCSRSVLKQSPYCGLSVLRQACRVIPLDIILAALCKLVPNPVANALCVSGLAINNAICAPTDTQEIDICASIASSATFSPGVMYVSAAGIPGGLISLGAQLVTNPAPITGYATFQVPTCTPPSFFVCPPLGTGPGINASLCEVVATPDCYNEVIAERAACQDAWAACQYDCDFDCVDSCAAKTDACDAAWQILWPLCPSNEVVEGPVLDACYTRGWSPVFTQLGIGGTDYCCPCYDS